MIKEILQSDKKHKEKVAFLTEKIKNDKNLLPRLFDLFKSGNDVEKGTCAEVMKFISKDKPEMMEPYIDTLIGYVNYKAPRVKWGVPESLGNLAHKYPEKTEKAIPYLLKNTKDKSTVIRWCAAYALTEIAKYSTSKQEELVTIFYELIKNESNNGVKNVFLKAIKIMER